MHSAGTRASILSSYSIGAVFLLATAIAVGPALLTPDPRDVSLRVNSLAFLYVARVRWEESVSVARGGGGGGSAWEGGQRGTEGCVRCLARRGA